MKGPKYRTVSVCGFRFQTEYADYEEDSVSEYCTVCTFRFQTEYADYEEDSVSGRLSATIPVLTPHQVQTPHQVTVHTIRVGDQPRVANVVPLLLL